MITEFRTRRGIEPGSLQSARYLRLKLSEEDVDRGEVGHGLNDGLPQVALPPIVPPSEGLLASMIWFR